MKKILYIYILLQPVFDIITGIMLNYFNVNLSINVIIKGLTILLLFIYIIFISKSKYKKMSTLYLGLIIIYFILYFLTKPGIFHIEFLINEITYAFKYFYYIIIFLGLINLFDNKGYEKEKVYKYLLITLFIYSLLIIIPYITGTGFYSYNEEHGGTRGWFTSANELSSMFAMLIPFAFYLIGEKIKNWKLIIIPISLLTLGLVGTKSSLLSIILIILFFAIFFIIKTKNKKLSFIAVFLFFTLIIGINYLPGMQIFKNNIEVAEALVDKNSTFTEKILTYTLRVRKKLYVNIHDIYEEQNKWGKLFGVGFSNREIINNEVVEKLVEIDPPDIYFRYGIIGTTIYFIPLIYVIGISFKKIFKKKYVDFYTFQNLFTIFIGMGISIFAGHIFGAPSASIYLSFAMAILFTLNNDFKTN